MLDGAARIKELVAAGKADGQTAMGITDHGNMYGAIEFYRECIAQGIKPVIGREVYTAKESRSERPSRKGKDGDDSGGVTEGGHQLNYHLTLLAENNEGYKNLIQVSSRAFLEGYYYKPRVDWDVLSDHSQGLIATTGCLGGQVLQALLHGDQRGATAIASRLQDIFGKDSLFVEIQDHGIPAQRQTYSQLIDVAKAIGAPLLATNDGHYVKPEDALNHDALLCVQTRCTMAEEGRFKFESDQHYLKTAQEMRYLFREIPSSCDNTLVIAERASVDIGFKDLHLPEFAVPDGFIDTDSYLSDLVLRGASSRWPDLTDEIISRLVYELKVIADMGFSSYFLIVWDLIRHAKEVGIRCGPGRGSAAGSAVAYTLGITEIDPIKYNLLFERFLNPSRVSMPDIDLDFDTRYREDMIRYTVDKYGSDHVAQIITFSTIRAKAAVRDAARVLGFPYLLSDKISKAMPPPLQGRSAPLKACFEYDPDWAVAFEKAQGLRDLHATNHEVQAVMKVALGLEGLRRQDGVHAAAVVISKGPLTDYVPIQQKGEGEPIITQYEMHAVEALGLLKMDFLGLRNIDVIDDCLRMLAADGVVIDDINSIPLDDQATFGLLQRGETVGVFQLESKGMQDLLKRLRPTSFEDVGALVALYRPGPMGANMHNDYSDRKNRRQGVVFYHPDAEEVLADTYGLMIYQEQVMQMAQQFAGYTLSEADNLRKAMGKKDKDRMAALSGAFVEGCVDRGYDRSLGESLFEMIERFSDYAFNKSHAYAYGLVAYQTAYLKANYPTYYMASLCSSTKEIETQSVALAEARRMGVQVKLPTINEALSNFSATADSITVGLSSIRDVGGALTDEIVAEREENGPFIDEFDVCFRLKVRGVKSISIKSFKALAEAGAFDKFGHSRQGLIAVRQEILNAAVKQKDRVGRGQATLFDMARPFTIPDEEFSEAEKFALEKLCLGVYVSGHPMDGLEEWAKEASTISLEDLEEAPDESVFWVAGVLTGIELKTTRSGDEMAHIRIEDQLCSVPITAFPANWKKAVGVMVVGEVYALRIRVTTGNWGDRTFVLVEAKHYAQPEAPVRANGTTSFKLYLPEVMQNDPSATSRLKGLLLAHRGSTPVALHVGRNTTVKLPDEYKVNVTPALTSACRDLFRSFTAR